MSLAVCVQNNNKQVTPFQTVDAIVKAGFKDVFVQYYRRENIDYDEIEVIKYCKKMGLNILFCHLGYRDINDIWLDEEAGELVTKMYIEDLDLMKSLDIDFVCMHMITHRECPDYNELGLERFRRIINHAKKLGIKIAFENTRKKGYLEFLLRNIHEDNIGICLDVGHLHRYFDDELDWGFFKDKIIAVHLHDNDKSDDLHLIPGEGTIDWKTVLEKLRTAGYNGPLTLELAYRYHYLEESIDEFYKKGYEAGMWLEGLNQ